MASMFTRKIYRCVAAAFLAALAAIPSLAAPPSPQDAPKPAASGPLYGSKIAPPIIEQGKFTLHKFEQPIGAETYEISSDDTSLTVKINFKFTDRGSPVPLTATFRCDKDLTPQKFEIKGNNSRLSTIDESVELGPQIAFLRDRDKHTEAHRPAQFFTIAGYAPAAMQMLMVRYWSTHGSPAEL